MGNVILGKIFRIYDKQINVRKFFCDFRIFADQDNVFFCFIGRTSGRISSFSSINGTSLFHDQHSYLHPDNYTIDDIALHLF